MLSEPHSGWSDFHLNGTQFNYGLSYLDDIAYDWLDQAIHGLETMLPFCVKGFMEPGRFLCLVSYGECLILIEDEDKNEVSIEESVKISMLDFCKELHSDISKHFDGWVNFVDYNSPDFEAKKLELQKLLNRLEELINEKSIYLGPGHVFL
ncbi:MAG: hypothetical protein IJ079_08915 [Lachnospiraceae bacterium]|nr:hypothetical protein [Lachnospiraceae bacterium]